MFSHTAAPIQQETLFFFFFFFSLPPFRLSTFQVVLDILLTPTSFRHSLHTCSTEVLFVPPLHAVTQLASLCLGSRQKLRMVEGR